LMDVRITGRAVGGVEIRTGAGILLAGQGAAKLGYVRASAVSAETECNEVMVIEPPAGKARSLAEGLSSGEIKGLLELRDGEAPATAERLAELMSRLADELNRAHNASSAAPPPNSLTGRNVGQSLETALQGFTGRTSIVITDGQGVVVQKVDLDLATLNPATFLADLNAQLGANGSASFVDGRLKIEGAAGAGVVVVDDPAAPSNKGGRGFSHFFGLNDLIASEQPTIYETGMTGGAQHGFTPGDAITFRFSDAAGAKLRDIEVAVPAGGDMTSLLAALNDPMTGAGRMGTFSLSAAGEMTFTPRPGSGATLSVLQDRTTQVPSGVSMSELFGLRGARASRADAFSIRADIARDPALIT